MDVDARLRAPRGPHADPRLRGDARGCHVGLCQELAAGNERRTPPPIRIAGAGLRRPPSFQSTPLVEGISVRGSTIEQRAPVPFQGKAARKENAKRGETERDHIGPLAATRRRARPRWQRSPRAGSRNKRRRNPSARPCVSKAEPSFLTILKDSQGLPRPRRGPRQGGVLVSRAIIRASLEPPEKDHERKNVRMGAALCSQSAPHTAQSAYQKGSARGRLCAIASRPYCQSHCWPE